MATKGPSNLYGNSKGKATEHINYGYAKEFNKNSSDKHDIKHLENVGAKTANEMKSKAIHFANDVDRINNVSFIDSNGTTYKYSKSTNELVLVTSDGYVVTYFKPGKGKNEKGWKYYLKQEEKYKRREK